MQEDHALTTSQTRQDWTSAQRMAQDRHHWR